MKGQVAIPETAEGLEELLNDDGRLGEVLAAGQFGELTKAYAEKAMGNTKAELGVQMREQLQVGMQSFLQVQAAQGFVP